jgi:DNA-binding MarR family transcriptional regulator
MHQYDDCIVFLLAKAYQRAHGVMKKHLTSYNITPIQHLVLEALWLTEGCSARELGQLLALDGATLSGVLDRLSESGWIKKETDPSDKRALRILLTPKGWDMKEELRGHRREANEEILTGLTLEERVLLKRLLRDIRD